MEYKKSIAYVSDSQGGNSKSGGSGYPKLGILQEGSGVSSTSLPPHVEAGVGGVGPALPETRLQHPYVTSHSYVIHRYHRDMVLHTQRQYLGDGAELKGDKLTTSSV